MSRARIFISPVTGGIGPTMSFREGLLRGSLGKPCSGQVLKCRDYHQIINI